MKKIKALFGWKYVKDVSNGKYHHYKCPKLNEIQIQKTFNKLGMNEDLSRHPYSVRTDICLEGIV